MGDRKLSLTALITLILTVSLPIANLPPLFQASAVLAQTPANRKDEADRLLQQGREQYQTNQSEAALKSWQQALIIYQKIRDYKSEVKVLNNIGLVHQQQAEYASAIDYLQRSLSIAISIKDQLGQAKALGNLGTVFQDTGDYAQSIYYHQQNLAIARKIKDKQSEGKALANLGLVYYFLGDATTAIKNYWEALAIFQKISDSQSQGASLNNLGLAYSAIGDYPKAIQNYQQALTIVREITNRQLEGKILGNLGSIYYVLGKYSQAIDYQQKWLAIARQIDDNQSQENAIGNLGFTYYTLKDYPKAIDYQQQSLAIARKINDRLGEGTSLLNLGLAFYKSGNLPIAEKSLYEAINIWEALRNTKLKLQDTNKVSLFDTQINTYTLLQQVLIAQNKPDRSLEISERGRARALVELIASRLSSDNSNEAKPPQSLTIAEMKQIANIQNSTLVQYSIIRDVGKVEFKELELYIWVIKPTGEVTFRKADLKPLWQKNKTTLNDFILTSRNCIGAKSTAFRNAIDIADNPNAPKAKDNLKRLHELLINPIADLLPKNSSDRVIFIPQSSLFLVPFAALQDADGKYLIEKHTILTSPSIQVLDLTHKQKQRIGTKPIEGKDTLIVGNPTMPFIAPKIGETPQQLKPLPGAELEANAISKLLKTEPLVGSKATEATVVKRLPQARFVHLATHGLFDDIQGLNSGIALTPSGKDDGLLTASQILDLKLNTELVVLSACDTGRGHLTGDGVIGLSRSFISAGVPSVLVSLWSVPDAPTALLMTEFYQNLQNGSDKAQALRQAMLTTMKNNPNPVDWAAFTLIGEAE
ncbi:MAG: CHAT domain-containing tetratricopeptide repeat protein [Nostoc sp.]|uniref:CHAT domain-containing protein n=1 Tax=Nostoc sp. TaxID=1180 RepID=UPI002FF6C2FE